MFTYTMTFILYFERESNLLGKSFTLTNIVYQTIVLVLASIFCIFLQDKKNIFILVKVYNLSIWFFFGYILQTWPGLLKTFPTHSHNSHM